MSKPLLHTRLEHAFNALKKPPNPVIAAQAWNSHMNHTLARYGAHSPADFARYLQSTRGQQFLAETERELDEIESIKAHHRIAERDEKMLYHRMLAHFLLKKMNKALHRKSLNREIQKQITEMLQKNADRIREANTSSAPAAFAAGHQQTDSAYLLALKAADALVEEKAQALAEEQELLMALRASREHIVMFSEATTLLLQHMEHDILQELEELQDPQLQETHLAQRCMHAALRAEEALVHFDTLQQNGETASHEQLAGLLQHLIAHQHLSDWHDVASGNRHAFDHNWEPCNSPHDAAYILHPELQVVREGNSCYLLPANTQLTDLSDRAREEARQNFEAREPEFRSVKRAVAQHLEDSKLDSQRQEKVCQTRVQKLSEEHQALVAQRRSIVESREDALKQGMKGPAAEAVVAGAGTTPSLAPRATAPTPAPTATPRPTPEDSRRRREETEHSYRTIARQMPRPGMPMPRAIVENPQPLGSLVEQMAQRYRRTQSQLTAGMAADSDLLRRARTLMRAPGEAPNPTATATTSPKAAPSPFSMRPDPWKV